MLHVAIAPTTLQSPEEKDEQKTKLGPKIYLPGYPRQKPAHCDSTGEKILRFSPKLYL
jgi:hypothetical protein